MRSTSASRNVQAEHRAECAPGAARSFAGVAGTGYSSIAPPRAGPGADVLEQRDGALEPFDRGVHVGAPLEPRRRLRLEPELLARAAHALRIEERAFEHDGLGARRSLPTRRRPSRRRRPAPCRASAMTSISGSSARSTPSSVVMRSPGRRTANPDFPAGELLEVERVHRLSELEQHVVGDVDDVVDRAHAGGLQPRRQPGRRGPDGDVGDGRRVARAQIRRFELDRHVVRWLRRKRLRDERLHRQRVRGRRPRARSR